MPGLAIATPDQINRPARPHYEVGESLAAGIAAGANAEISVTVQNDGVMLLTEIGLAAMITATAGGAVAKSPLARDASPTAASNTHPQLGMLRISIRDNIRTYTKSPVRADLLCSPGGLQRFLGSPLAIEPNTKIIFTVYNDSAVTIDVQIVLAGRMIGG